MDEVGEFDGRRYQERFDQLAASGVAVHGEAEFVSAYAPRHVLDAGCGTGRVAIELARRGVEVVGVDLDSSMLAEARRRAPDLAWRQADLASVDLGQRFDVVLLAGNVPIFCARERRADLVLRCAGHVAIGGRLIAGFQLDRGYRLEDYDAAAEAAGLVRESRFATWDRAPYFPGTGDYAVTVHRCATE